MDIILAQISKRSERNRYETVRATTPTWRCTRDRRMFTRSQLKIAGVKTAFRRRRSRGRKQGSARYVPDFFTSLPFLSLPAGIAAYVLCAFAHEHLTSNALFSLAVWQPRLKRNLNDTCLEWPWLGQHVSLYVPKITHAPGGRRRPPALG